MKRWAPSLFNVRFINKKKKKKKNGPKVFPMSISEQNTIITNKQTKTIKTFTEEIQP